MSDLYVRDRAYWQKRTDRAFMYCVLTVAVIKKSVHTRLKKIDMSPQLRQLHFGIAERFFSALQEFNLSLRP